VDHEILALSARAIRATAGHTLWRSPHFAMRECRKVIDALARFDDDAAALAAIAAVRPALRYVPQAPKAHTAIATATGLKFDLATVNKHNLSLPKSGDFGYGH
jgi:hypothetical protein